jgi:hypothetical protein
MRERFRLNGFRLPATRLLVLSVMACADSAREKPAVAVPNRPPVFPDSVQVAITTDIQRDGRGTVTGAITTVTAGRAIDLDGDSLSYKWEGARFNGDTLVPVTLDADGLTAKFRSGVIMNEAAGGVLRITATDSKGNKAEKEICVPGGGFSC